MAKTGTSTAIYCRISDDTTGEGSGVKRQEADCVAFCEQKGWTVAEVIVDNDVSAYSGRKRPGYERLIAGIGAGEFDTLVVWHPDRLHRSPAELEGFIDLVERTGIHVATVTAGELDLSTPDGRLTARIVGSVARKESEDKSRRIRRKHLEIAEAGKVSGGGRRPFGYEADRVTIRQDEAGEIRSAAAAVIAGASVRSIVTDWNTRGIKTVTGARWSGTTVKRMLLSARLSGQRSHHGRIVGPAEWPAILAPDDTLKLRAVLESRPATGPTVRSYLLSGIVRCGRCDVPMTAAPVKRKGHRYRRYACRVDRGGCGRCGIGAQGVEVLVVDAVLDRLDTPQLAEVRAEHEAGERDDAAAPTAAVHALEERMAELAEMFAAGEISRTEWSTARDGIAQRLTDAQRVLAAGERGYATADALDGIGSLRDEWPALDLDTQRRILEVELDAVVIAPTDRANNQFDPGRASIRWVD